MAETKKTMKMVCCECMQNFEISAKDADIRQRLNGGIPRLRVTVECPYCNKIIPIEETPEAKELLAERIKNKDYNGRKATIVFSH